MRRRRVVVAVGAIVAAVGVTAGVLATRSPSKRASAPGSTRSLTLFATLDALSCPAAGRCTAVGHVLVVDKDATEGDPDGDGQATRTLVEVLGVGGWHRIASPDEGSGGDALSGVSCPSTSECVAVGNYRPAPFGAQATTAPPVYPLIEALRNGRWEIVPGPPAPPDTALDSLACPSATSCTAVGTTTSDAGSASPVESPFVETFDGSTWSVVAAAGPARASTELKSVSCSSASSCIAVGDTAPASDPSATRPFAWQFTGGSWRVLSPTSGSIAGTLADVTCSTPGRCVAVGNAVTGPSSGSALVVSLDAAGWHVDPTALAQGGDISLSAVDCAPRGGCVVAGIALQSALRILARVDAGGWLPISGYDQNETVQAVACPPTAACVVVGSSYVNGYGNTTALVGSLAGGTLEVRKAPT